MRKFTSALFLLALCTAASPASAATCTALYTDLKQGAYGPSVMILQNFLRESGYLSAAPNSYFGISTFTAVKKFQSANNISATGFVGPVTRSAIKEKSCAVALIATTTPSTSPKIPLPAPVTAPTTYGVTSPDINEPIAIGRDYTIRWRNEIKSDYSIILEDEYGVAQGYITSNKLGGKSFVWKTGNVTYASGETKIVQPGNYKVRIRPTHEGASLGDQVSGTFSLTGALIKVISVTPSTVPRDANAAIVLYGRGFTPTTSVYLDGIRNIRTSRLYISPDGKVIVFSIPEDVASGTHVISIRNSYGEVANAGTIIVE